MAGEPHPGLRQWPGDGGHVSKPMFNALFHRSFTTQRPFPWAAWVPLSALAIRYISPFKDIDELNIYI